MGNNEIVLTDIERKALVGLFKVASAADWATDNSVNDGDGYHKVECADVEEIGRGLDILDELPDDQPGYTNGPAGRAEWALRRLFGGTTEGGSR